MKNTIKALSMVLAPSIIMAVIFNVTVLKAYANAKTLEADKVAREYQQNVKRMPAVLTVVKR